MSNMVKEFWTNACVVTECLFIYLNKITKIKFLINDFEVKWSNEL